MRTSLSIFIDTCFDIKCHLQVGSYELHDYDDGSYADFKVATIKDPKALNRIIGKLEYKIFAGDGYCIIRVFEEFKE